MINIESDTFNIDAVMGLLGGIDTNGAIAGTWNRILWRIWLNEPSDTLQRGASAPRTGDGSRVALKNLAADLTID
jgi:hypothetical protein